jgi:periplasmic protein TonB
MKKKRKLNWNDIVFEFKNKEYGAFFLREIYRKDISIAAGISLLILLLLIGPPFIMAKLNKKNNSFSYAPPPVSFFDANTADIPPPPPPPPPTPIDDIRKQIKIKIIIVDTLPTEIELETNDQIKDNEEFRKVIEDIVVPVENKIIEPPAEIPTWVPEMPVFPGGDDAMLKYIKENFKYPLISKENNMDGKVYVCFVVNENGKVVQVEILRGIDKYIDKEAIRVVESLPTWSPGKQNGVPVKVKLIIPINLQLTY